MLKAGLTEDPKGTLWIHLTPDGADLKLPVSAEQRVLAELVCKQINQPPAPQLDLGRLRTMMLLRGINPALTRQDIDAMVAEAEKKANGFAELLDFVR